MVIVAHVPADEGHVLYAVAGVDKNVRLGLAELGWQARRGDALRIRRAIGGGSAMLSMVRRAYWRTVQVWLAGHTAVVVGDLGEGAARQVRRDRWSARPRCVRGTVPAAAVEACRASQVSGVWTDRPARGGSSASAADAVVVGARAGER
jgi:hypothetical protein